jgi:hypothetical protein
MRYIVVSLLNQILSALISHGLSPPSFLQATMERKAVIKSADMSEDM